MEKVRTLFIGTSSFAVPAFEALSRADFIELVGVVSQPDKPAGRDQKLTAPAVKQGAEKLGISKIFQPEKIREEADKILEETKPDLIIVASYGQILPGSIINYPKYKCLNIHGSILPELRGAVPIPMAILKGFDETGVSLIVMSEKMDDGPIVSTSKLKIADSETTETLTEKLAELGAKELIGVIPDWVEGKIEAKVQDESKATYCYMKDISKENAEVDFSQPAEQIERMVRAFYPWPGTWMWVETGGQKKRLKIIEAEVLNIEEEPELAGSIHEIFQKMHEKTEDKTLFTLGKRLFAHGKEGVLELLTVQLEGKKPGAGANYLYLAQNK